MGSDIRGHNHLFLIAQVQKIGVLQLAISDEYASNRNGELSNPPSLITSTCYFFHNLLVSSQELTFPRKSVA